MLHRWLLSTAKPAGVIQHCPAFLADSVPMSCPAFLLSPWSLIPSFAHLPWKDIIFPATQLPVYTTSYPSPAPVPLWLLLTCTGCRKGEEVVLDQRCVLIFSASSVQPLKQRECSNSLDRHFQVPAAVD